MTARVTALLFDLGDTLWHFPDMPPMERINDELVSRFGNLLRGWGVDSETDLDILAANIRSAIQDETRRASLGDCVSPNYPDICRKAAGNEGLTLSSSQAGDLWEAWNLGGSFLGRRLFPDAMDTLCWLRDHGYRLGCVTNRGYGGRRFQDEMQDCGLDDLFEVVSVSTDVGYLKPHPRIFVHALEEMDLTPQETVMVGDSLRADVGGAKALGMVTVWRRLSKEEKEAGLPGYPDQVSGEEQPEPDFVVSSMADLKSLPIITETRA